MKTRPLSNTLHLRCASVDSLADLVGTLKKCLSAQLIRQFRSRVPAALIKRAIDEAEEVARSTEFPHLFLPELATEQVRRIVAVVAQDEPELALHRAA